MSWIKDMGRSRNLREFAKGYLVPSSLLSRKVLNQGEPRQTDVDPTTIAASLKKLGNRLEGEAYVADGRVDYARLSSSKTYAELLETSRRLQAITSSALPTDAERIAFFVNLYNVMMIHGVIALGITTSVKEIPSFFTTVAYRIGEHLFTPDDIEHGLLRLNQPHPMTRRRPMKKNDPRLDWAPSKLDWRIHMSLVCVAESCPPIAFYDAEKLDVQLDMAARIYVSQVQIFESEKTIEIPSIFGFYESDFGGRQGIGEILLRYSQDEARPAIERALTQDYRWKYPSYDWSLNGTEHER